MTSYQRTPCPDVDSLAMKKPEVRRLDVALYFDNWQSVRRAAANANMSRRILTRFLSYVEETGNVHYGLEKWNKHEDAHIRCPDLRAAVMFSVEQYPAVYLDEISYFIGRVQALLGTDFSISSSSVSCMSAANGITRKVIETCCISRNELSRAQWVQSQWEIPVRARVYVEEAHRCGRSAERKWAWKLRGQRAECYVTNRKGVSTSFFVAVGHDKVLDWLITQPPPGQSSVDFLLFALAHLLPHMNAYDAALPWSEHPERCVMMLDNARVNDELALAVIEAAGVFGCRLPPYSPEINTIEDVISVGSSWLRRDVSQDQFNDWPF